MMLFSGWKLLYIFDLLVRIKPCLGSATKTAFLVILYTTTKCCCCQKTIQGRGASSFSFSKSRSEEHTSELQSRPHLVCRLLLEKKKKNNRKFICSTNDA